MRASCDENDPGYANWQRLGSACKVFLDGVELRGVFTADEEKRMVIAADFDENGKYQLDETRERVKMSTRYGHVRIECAS